MKGSDHPHGFLIDAKNRRAYISCEGNNRLIVADLADMKATQNLPVADGPDVLALDQSLGRLYVGCEGGEIDVFQETSSGLTPIGDFRAPNAHTVSVDQKTHRVFIALKNVNGKPEMWVLKPK